MEIDPRYRERLRRAMHSLDEFRLWACTYGLEVVILKHGDEWHMRRDGADVAIWTINLRAFSFGAADHNSPTPMVSSTIELRQELMKCLK